MDEWIPIMERYKNTALQLICVKGVASAYRPQNQPLDKTVSGSGFIIDIERGLVMTNAHVVANAISITARIMKLGEYNLSLRLISLCREKDVALCQLCDKDIAKILEDTDPDKINAVFGDSLKLVETMSVIAIGYPLGQRHIKFTTGIISGFHANTVENDETRTDEEQSGMLQITAPLNEGISGSCLLNKFGHVVGINSNGYVNSQNIGYAIPSRSILAIYDELILPLRNNNVSVPYVVITPKYAFEYNKASNDLLEFLFSNLDSNDTQSIPNGVYVKNVYPNSCFDKLRRGDLLTKISYVDTYFDETSFDVINRLPRMSGSKSNNLKGRHISLSVDKYGDVTFNIGCDMGYVCRKMSIKEVFDMIPVGTRIKLDICRNNGQQSGCYDISAIFKYVDSNIKYLLYPIFTPPKYEIVAGLSLSNLTMNHILDNENLEEYSRRFKRYKPYIVVNQIFPDTTAFHLDIFNQGSIIKTVNGQKVTDLSQLNDVLKNTDTYIIITTTKYDTFVIKRETAIEEDYGIFEKFNVDQDHILERHT
jgi:S1-C subfamily serine protease